MINLMIGKRFGGATGFGLDFVPVIPPLPLSLSSSSSFFPLSLLLSFLYDSFHFVTPIIIAMSLSCSFFFFCFFWLVISHNKFHIWTISVLLLACRNCTNEMLYFAMFCRHFSKLFHYRLLTCSDESYQASNSQQTFL